VAKPNAHPQNVSDVVIIGAGPYGLSIAAHLAAYGVPFRIFGDPMSAWSGQMPKGMRLKSEGFASSLSDPGSEFTLHHYCQQQGIEYADTGYPIPLATFISYGLAFQRKFVPNLENKLVVALQPSSVGFDLQLEDGEKVVARKVVVAVGITHFWHLPHILKALPEGFVSHSSAHSSLEAFKGSHIAVVGAGASALDLAALLHQAGAAVQVIARASTIRFHEPPRPRSLVERVFQPTTGIGFGMKLYFFVHAPFLFRRMPQEFRLEKVRQTLGPAPGWFVRDQVVGKVPLNLGVNVTNATVQNGRACLRLTDSEGRHRTIEADHVIAATGYQVDLSRLSFLSGEIRQRIRTVGKAPALSATFESSVPGMYFVGVSAANTFGPLMRFAYGASFTARRLSKHLAKPIHGKSMLHKKTDDVRVFQRV
jgi:cation diffusion facilitator CzcD-associated flavoprotein CzcO